MKKDTDDIVKLMSDAWRSITYSVEIETAMLKVLHALEENYEIYPKTNKTQVKCRYCKEPCGNDWCYAKQKYRRYRR